MRKNCLPFLAALAVCSAAIWMTQPATAQVPSTLDTMRILDVSCAVGDTVIVEFYIRNVDTLGAYNFRLRFDPAIIEPLTDTVVDGANTYHYLESSQARGTAFEQFSGASLISQPGVATFLAADYYFIDTDLFLPGTGVAMQMPWRVKPSATPQTVTIAFENDPVFPQSYNTTVDIRSQNFKRPVLVTGVFTISGEACDCPFQGDADLDGFVTSLDMGKMIDILFGGQPDIQEPLCLSPRFDVDCDGFTTSLDLGSMIDYLFAGGNPPCDPCSQP